MKVLDRATKRPTPLNIVLLMTIAVLIYHVVFIACKLPSPVLSNSVAAAAMRPEVHLIVFTTGPFSDRYKTHNEHVKCYADRHGYLFRHLQPTGTGPCADLKSAYFSKHCAIADYLETRPRGAVAFILDADVVPGARDTSLDFWMDYVLKNDVDIAFYERSWNFEIMAGNYVVRNTPFGIGFLRYWSAFGHVEPPGFGGVDNGPIHLAVVDALALRGRKRCRALYDNLTALVTDLGPYYEFVACTKALLGPPALYPVKDDGKRKGAIAIFPRFFGLGIDAKIWGFVREGAWHPFHHGEKSEEWEADYAVAHADGVKCPEYKSGPVMSTAALGKRIREADLYTTKTSFKEASVVPRWVRGKDDGCYERMDCYPVEFKATWPAARIGNASTTVLKRGRVERVNEVVRMIESGSYDVTKQVTDSTVQ